MENYKFLAICMVLWFSSVEISKSTPESDGSMKIHVSSQRNETGKLHTQVKIEQVSGEKVSCEVDIHCGTSGKCDSPKPLYDFFPELGYYKLHTFAKGWNEGKLICEKEGAHLAIINSQRELEVLQELRRRLPRLRGDWLDDIILMGFTDVEKHGTWITIFNKPLEETGFSVWDEGQPGTTEHCGCFSAKTGKLHDCGCNDVLAFLCEREL